MPFLGPIPKGFSSSSCSDFVSGFDGAASWSINAEPLSLIMHDLVKEGLLKKKDKALIVSPPSGFESVSLWNNVVDDGAVESDLERHDSLTDESFDFVFTPSFQDNDFADGIQKIYGIVAFSLNTNHPLAGLRKLSNYRVVYFRQYGSIVVALRKTGFDKRLVNSSTKRKLCQLSSEAKRVALKGLEDVLPLRQAFAKSKKLKINYLPDLLGDSLEAYKRRVFIAIGLPEENC